MPKQPTLCFDQPAFGVIRETANALAAQHAMARHYKRKRVGAAGLTYRTRGAAQCVGHFTVLARLAGRDCRNRAPYPPLERGAALRKRQRRKGRAVLQISIERRGNRFAERAARRNGRRIGCKKDEREHLLTSDCNAEASGGHCQYGCEVVGRCHGLVRRRRGEDRILRGTGG